MARKASQLTAVALVALALIFSFGFWETWTRWFEDPNTGEWIAEPCNHSDPDFHNWVDGILANREDGARDRGTGDHELQVKFASEGGGEGGGGGGGGAD